MQAKNYSVVLMVGLLVLGFLFVPHALPWGPAEAQAVGEPVIQFVAPAGTPRYMDTADPIDPAIVIDVEVDFPEGASACAGPPPPVQPASLVVTVNRQLDGAVLETWPVDTSGWIWSAGNNNVTGQVTIGGQDSGQNRSFYGIKVCISNGTVACATKGVRVEYPVSEFVGGNFYAKATSFSQNPGCNLIDSGLIPIINSMMGDALFGVTAPSASEITAHSNDTVGFLQIPLIGSIDMTASLNGGTNEVDLGPVSVSGIDLGDIEGLPAGYNCKISGSADGRLLGEVSPGQDLDGDIRVYGITLEDGGGQGACTRQAEGCELRIPFDGYPYVP